MFRDTLYFMNPSEHRSYNRCVGAPGCKLPTREDEDRFHSLEMKVGDITKLRTESGHKVYIPENN